MTEEIIVDGVNVAGCMRLQDDKISCDLDGKCEGWKNCYYKQLKRAGIKIEKLKGVDGSVHPDSAYYKITRLEQENNSLQAQLNNITVQSNNVITALEQENKELKEEIQFHNKENSNLLAERNAAQIGYDEIREVRERYRSALEEIREVLKFYADTWAGVEIYPNLHFDNTKAKEGLSRINEVLE